MNNVKSKKLTRKQIKTRLESIAQIVEIEEPATIKQMKEIAHILRVLITII